MDIRIRAVGFQLTSAIEDYVRQRVASLEKMLGADAGISRCEVELSRSAGNERHSEYAWRAEIQILHPGGTRIVARNQEPTINAAIDNAKDEAAMQLRKEKRTSTRVLRKTGAAIKRWMRLGGE